MPTPEEIARAAVRACLQDLRERQGFKQLIERIQDWSKVEVACVANTVKAIEPLFPKPKQETIDFL